MGKKRTKHNDYVISITVISQEVHNEHNGQITLCILKQADWRVSGTLDNAWTVDNEICYVPEMPEIPHVWYTLEFLPNFIDLFKFSLVVCSSIGETTGDLGLTS